MKKTKKGQRLVCVPCGKEVIVSNAGVSDTTLWCCGSPMKPKTGKKKTSKKPSKK